MVVDVVLEDGVLHLELANLADRPALDVVSAFDPPLRDAAGRDVSELRLFRGMPFLGPHRRVRTLLDSVAGLARGDGLQRVAVTVEYARPGERRRSTRVTHDLAAYGELALRV